MRNVEGIRHRREVTETVSFTRDIEGRWSAVEEIAAQLSFAMRNSHRTEHPHIVVQNIGPVEKKYK
jgi:hypothetical protein